VLGHSSFVLTLSTYADYINEDDLAAPKVGRGVADTGNVVALQRKRSSHFRTFNGTFDCRLGLLVELGRAGLIGFVEGIQGNRNGLQEAARFP